MGDFVFSPLGEGGLGPPPPRPRRLASGCPLKAPAPAQRDRRKRLQGPGGAVRVPTGCPEGGLTRGWVCRWEQLFRDLESPVHDAPGRPRPGFPGGWGTGLGAWLQDKRLALTFVKLY